MTENSFSAELEIEGIIRRVIDVPGFADLKGKDIENIEEMVQFLKTSGKGVDWVALIVIIKRRLDESIQNYLKKMNTIFNNTELWNHFCIIFTRAREGQYQREARECDFCNALRQKRSTFSINIPLFPSFSVDSLNWQTDSKIMEEINKFHEFAASLENPIAPDGLLIPDEIFMRISKRELAPEIIETQPIQNPL